MKVTEEINTIRKASETLNEKREDFTKTFNALKNKT